MTIVAIDAGGDTTKIYDGQNLRVFPSAIGYDWRERNLKQQQGDCDYEWSYNRQKGFAGTLALYESDCVASQKGDTKAHSDALLRQLIALHQNTSSVDCKVVVGQPVGKHTDEEKSKIKEMVVGRHDITVNGQRKLIVVSRCEVAAEGVTAGLLVTQSGVVRVIDIGSGTVNFGTLIDRRYNDRGSFTLATGLETLRATNHDAFARQIALRAFAGNWSKDDAVYLCGGGATQLQAPLRMYFDNLQLIPGDPVTANVRAFYLIARRLYG